MARFQPGQSGNPAGRPVGTLNKSSQAAKDLILSSLEARGGLAYLNGLADELFAPLLRAVIPRELSATIDPGPRTVQMLDPRRGGMPPLPQPDQAPALPPSSPDPLGVVVETTAREVSSTEPPIPPQ